MRGWHHADVQISAKAEYAIRACLVLAGADRPMSAEAVAMHADLPSKFLEAILTELRVAGLLVSQRGQGGGTRLARPPGTITLADVMRAVDGPLAQVHGLPPDQVSYTGAAAPLQTIWVATRAAIRSVLETTTLEHVVNATLPPEVVALAGAPGAWAVR